MKTFIVFLAIFILNISFLIFQADLARYDQSQNFLKATAEECAAGAALFYDEGAYAEGNIVFKESEAIKYTEYIIEQSRKRMPYPKDSDIQYTIQFEDDLNGYIGGKNPAITIKLQVTTTDIFRLPFLKMNQITRMAKYELPEV